MIEKIEDYFAKGCGRCERFATPDCSTKRWTTGLAALRQLCLKSGLKENVKWGHPCYTHAGRNIAIIGAFRNNFRLTFFNAALMKDRQGVLSRSGPNTQHPETIAFTDNADVKKMQATIAAYLKEAMTYAEQGLLPTKPKHTLELPAELTDALDADAELAQAFQILTPGRQRSYVIMLNSAKTSATRATRIAKFRQHILSGKGANER